MAVLQNLWIRGGKQKLGGVVLYQMNGQTLARELAPAVSNPRTTAQMRQRVRLSNLVAFYKANRSWMRNAFEDKKERESDYNAFVAANIGTSLVALTKSEVSSGAAVVGPYQITRGSLLSIEHTLSGSTIKTNINLGNYQVTAASTIGELSTAILANNLTLAEGMQLSLIVNTQQAGNASQQPYIVCRSYELLLNRQSTALLTEYFPESVTSVAAGTNNYALALATTTYAEGGAAFILSQSVGGVTRVSSQRLQMFGSQTVYRSHTSESAMAAAIASYGQGTDVFLDTNAANALLDAAQTMTLLSIDLDGANITSGAEIYSAPDVDMPLTFRMSQPIPEGAVVSVAVDVSAAGNGEVPSPTISGNTISGNIEGDFSEPADRATCTFAVTINGVTYTLTATYRDHMGD